MLAPTESSCLLEYSCELTVQKLLSRLKSLGPIDRKFHGHGENNGFVLYEHIIKKFSSFCKRTNISDLKKKLSNKITCKQ